MAERYAHPERIHNYRYQGMNHSLVDRLLRHWWKVAIRFIPPRASANAVSIVGNAGSWLAAAVLVFFGASHGRTHPWLFVVVAVCIIFYHTLDCLDGMQARCTGSSGPLGEFVDHWFDSFNIFFFPLGMVAAFPVFPVPLALALVLVALLSDWISLREVIDTNVLIFPAFSSEEAVTLYWVFNLTVAVLGYDFWVTPRPLFGSLAIGALPPVYLLAAIGLIGSGVMAVIVLVRLRFAGLREMVAEVLALVPVIVWTMVMSQRTESRWVLIAGMAVTGFTASRFVGDLLRARLFGLAYPVFYWDNLAAGALVLASLGFDSVQFPVLALMLYLGTTVVALVLQFVRSIRLVRRELGIGLFGSLPKS